MDISKRTCSKLISSTPNLLFLKPSLSQLFFLVAQAPNLEVIFHSSLILSLIVHIVFLQQILSALPFKHIQDTATSPPTLVQPTAAYYTKTVA